MGCIGDSRGKHHWYGDMCFEGTPYEIYLTYPVSEQEIARIPREILEKLLRCWEMAELTDPNNEFSMTDEMAEWMDRRNIKQILSDRDLTEERNGAFLGKPKGSAASA
jgi:hypothetical protein